MAYSRIVKIGDGATTQFAVTFPLGYIAQANITARVGTEVDGLGAPVYRTITFLGGDLLQISGTAAGVGVEVVFERTTDKSTKVVSFANGDIMNDSNLDLATLQAMLLVHEVLDGRIGPFQTNLDLSTYKITGMGDPTLAQDAATKNYVDTAMTSQVAQATTAKDGAVTAQVAAAASATASSNNAAATAADKIATNADAVSTAADALATAADAAATAADKIATNADAAATAADVVLTHADVVTTNADAASTGASLSSMYSMLIGAAAADPTVDLNGNPVSVGQLYWNTTVGEMRVYNGVAWEVSYAPVSGYALLTGATFTGDVTVQGAFTSKGIDDNALATALSLSATTSIWGVTGTSDNFVQQLEHDDAIMFISGGNAFNAGAVLRLYGGTHATQAGDIQLWSQNTQVYNWDQSAGSHTFRNAAGASIAFFTGGQNLYTYGSIYPDATASGGTFLLGMSGANPAVTFDTGDLLNYDKTGNVFYFTIGGSNVAYVTAGGFAQNGNYVLDAADIGTTAQFYAGTAGKLLGTEEVWVAAANVALTDAASITVNMATFINATVTLGGNRTLANPVNPKVGQTGFIRVVQDATGGRTLAYGTYYKFQDGAPPILSTAANAVDLLFYVVLSSTETLITGVNGVA